VGAGAGRTFGDRAGQVEGGRREHGELAGQHRVEGVRIGDVEGGGCDRRMAVDGGRV
jgi:hypothetical protein